MPQMPLLSAAAPPARNALPVAWALLIVCGAAYGLLVALNRIVTAEGIPFLPYIFWQTLGAALFLHVLCFLRRRPPPLSRAHLALYLALGINGLALPWSILAYVSPKIPVGVIALTFALEPMLVYAMAVGLRMDRFQWLRLFGLVCGFAGILLIALPEASLPDPGMAVWIPLCLAAITCFSVTVILTQRMRPATGDAWSLSAGLLTVACLALLPAMAISGEWWVFDAPFSEGEWVVLVTIPVVVLLWVQLFIVVELAGAVFFSTVAYVDMLSGVAFGLLFFGERHSTYIWGALGLLVAGLYFVNRRRALSRSSAAARTAP